MKKTDKKALEVSHSEEQTGLDRTAIRKLSALVHKTNVEQPKPEDVQALRKMLTETPNLWRALGDLAKLSMQVVLAGNWLKPDRRISIETGIDNLKKDFEYKDAPVIEKLLIDQIMVSWVLLQKCQMHYAARQQSGDSLPEADYWERKVTASHMRFLRACETLARVRKLSRPSAMQVNIGAQQMNVAQASSSTDEDSGEQTNLISISRLAPPSES